MWFDCGTSHAYVLDSGRWPDLSWPADIYVEGSDQHRGWFQSSLLESCATRGRAPYDAILTHGFTMDAKGMKMSKSLGNTVDPNKVMETYGADIIRLWALSVDFTEDHRIGDEILKGVADQYRKLRNTFRYLLGALDGFEWESEGVGYGEMPELERYVLARLAQLDATIRTAIDSYDFNEYVRALIEFCNEDLSARSISISARTVSIATTRRGPSAARRAQCSISCSRPWSATPRRCWCSPPRKCGARVFRHAAASTSPKCTRCQPNSLTRRWWPDTPRCWNCAKR